MTTLEQKQKDRYAILRALYDLTSGRKNAPFPLPAIAEKAGVEGDEAQDAAEYLLDEGVVTFMSFGPTVGITHAGVVEIEATLRPPDRATEHFPQPCQAPSLSWP